jgi:mannose-6-phosphate isomerase-like protein (cupin superfamily)
MERFIKSNKTHVKKNSSTSEVSEYVFHQPNIGIAKAKINGRYPAVKDKKVINTGCDIIYFVLEGSGVIHTKDGDFKLEKSDALLLPRKEWYWVDGNDFEVLIISAPEWTIEQYMEL